MNFVETIKKKRQSLNLKQKDIADQLGVTPGMFSKVEKGQSMLGKEKLLLLNEILEFENNFLVELAEKQQPANDNNINKSKNMETNEDWEKKYNALHQKYSSVLEELLEYKNREIEKGKEPGHASDTGS